jgi:uncharacterized phiE125 gp8 family phage protein
MAEDSGTGTPVDSSLVCTVDEVKEALRLTASHHDDLIERLIAAATGECQNYQGHKYLTVAVVEYFDAWPAVIRPRWVPLVSVTSIAYIDTNGDAQTLAADQYDVDADGWPGRIAPAYNCSWPDLRGDINGVTLTYQAGYGPGSDDVPQNIRNAVILRTAELYNAPEGGQAAMGQAVRALLGAERMVPA